ncbi:probable glutathione S-transferase GSTU6 [Lolium perenne]|uniref:probable glutathione S-transferase GSTU6 n=1 Tax=Lolium perenne TaxID=4522 RepID=UPI003A997F2C
MDGGGDEELKVLGSWASPYVARVKLALHLKGVHYSTSTRPSTFPGVGPRLLPTDPYERAVARFWAAFVEDKLLVPWGMVLRAGADEERAQWTRQTVAAVGTLQEGLSECSGGKGNFFDGECVGYACRCPAGK